jgi:hypothetical protein
VNLFKGIAVTDLDFLAFVNDKFRKDFVLKSFRQAIPQSGVVALKDLEVD